MECKCYHNQTWAHFTFLEVIAEIKKHVVIGVGLYIHSDPTLPVCILQIDHQLIPLTSCNKALMPHSYGGRFSLDSISGKEC